MSEVDRKQARIKGSRCVVLRAQELGWAVGYPLTRVDWRPNPELEDPQRLTANYQLSLSSNARRVQGELPADWVEGACRGGEFSAKLEARLQTLIDSIAPRRA